MKAHPNSRPRIYKYICINSHTTIKKKQSKTKQKQKQSLSDNGVKIGLSQHTVNCEEILYLRHASAVVTV